MSISQTEQQKLRLKVLCIERIHTKRNEGLRSWKVVICEVTRKTNTNFYSGIQLYKNFGIDTAKMEMASLQCTNETKLGQTANLWDYQWNIAPKKEISG